MTTAPPPARKLTTRQLIHHLEESLKARPRAKPLRTVQVVQKYLTHLRASTSDAHAATAGYHLRRLSEYSVILPSTPDEIRLVMINARNKKTGGPLADASRRGIWIYIRGFYNWAEAELDVPNATDGTKKPSAKDKVRRIYTQDQLWRLIEYPHPNPRDNALLRLIADVGPRLGEIAGLTWENITPDSVILNYGKTGEHEVPIHPDTARALRRLPPGPSLWLCETGPRRGLPLAKEGLQFAIKRAIKRVGLTGGPHKIRHTFGRLFLRNGGSVTDLQRYLGHTSTKTTEIYAREEIEDLKLLHARRSPAVRRTRLIALQRDEYQAPLELDIG